MKCLTCSHPADIQGFCEGCYDDLCSGGNDSVRIAKKLTAIIAVQHETIQRQQRVAELIPADEKQNVFSSRISYPSVERINGDYYIESRSNEMSISEEESALLAFRLLTLLPSYRCDLVIASLNREAS